MCKVERVIVQVCKLKSTPLQLSNNLFSYQHPIHPLTHTLFITATAKTTKCLPLNVQASPQAALDHYQGDVKMLNSPDWVWSEKTQYIFTQLWMSFANLFAKLACCWYAKGMPKIAKCAQALDRSVALWGLKVWFGGKWRSLSAILRSPVLK